jgi:hypothetical protein
VKSIHVAPGICVVSICILIYCIVTVGKLGPNPCVAEPHYVLGVIAILMGFLSGIVGLAFFAAGAAPQIYERPTCTRYPALLGVFLLIFGCWLLYHGFGLITFATLPCT